jgi:hypothetical protein
MIGWKHLGSVLVLATVGLSSAGAFGWFRPAPRSSVTCYPAPIVVYSGWAYAQPMARAYSPTMPLAVPPPSTGEPPLLRKVEMPQADKPNVVESRSARSACRVGFWNLAGRDVTLVVDGQARVVPRDRTVTLDLAREFVWRVDQQPAQNERIADDKSTHDIVIR